MICLVCKKEMYKHWKSDVWMCDNCILAIPINKTKEVR